MRVAVFDTGLNLGYGVLGRNYVRSGTLRLEGSWCRMDLAFRTMTAAVKKVVDQHGPIDAIGACRPFVGRLGVNHMNMIPIMGFYAKLQEIAADLGVPFHDLYEPDCRKAFLSPSPVPRKSKDIKAAIERACELRHWPATDSHAADALCAADMLLAKLDKGAGWERTPLLINSKGRRLRVKSVA